MKCPDCNAKVRKKQFKDNLKSKGSIKCRKCGYIYKVGDFINWDEMTHTIRKI